MPHFFDTRVWDAVNGSDSNSGASKASAWKTFNGAAQAAWISANIPNRRMVLVPSGIYSPSGSSDFATWGLLSINQDGMMVESEGDNPVKIYGDAVLAEPFSHTGSGIWQATLATGLTIGGALFDHRNVTYSAINGRQLRGGLMLSDASATPALYKWNYNSVTGAFVVNTGSAANDPNGRVSIFRAGDFNLVTVEGEECTVQGLELSVAGPFSTSSYGIQLRGTRHRAVNIKSDICGYHPLGASGSACVDNEFSNCIGGTGGATSTCFVLHATSGNVSGRILDCEAHARGHIFPDGTTIAGHSIATGVYMHTSGSNPITNIEIRNTRIYVHGNNDNGFGVCSDSDEIAAFTGSRTSPDGRAIRFVNVQTFNDTFSFINGAPLFQRCRFNYSNAGPSGNAVSAGVIRIQGSAGTGCPALPLWESCEVLSNLDNASNVVSLFQGWNSPALQLNEGATVVSSTVLDTGTGSNQAGLFVPIFTNCVMAAYSSVLGFSGGKTTGRLFKADTGCTILAADNVYANIATNAYSDVTTRDAASEWTSTIDATAVHLTSVASMGLVSPTTSAMPNADSVLRAVRVRPVRAIADIDGRATVGAAGCYQFPARRFGVTR